MLRRWSRLGCHYSRFGGAPVPGDVKSNSELEFLTAIERGEVVTHTTLRKCIGVSIGLINAL
jgi:hypothetical protein